jgi:hypothetical protein
MKTIKSIISVIMLLGMVGNALAIDLPYLQGVKDRAI